MIMDTASFSGTIRTIVILILVYYLLKFLFRLLAPVIVQQVVKKAGQSFQEHQQQQYQQYQQHNQQQPTGNIKSDKPREKKKVGEYIDYEEIE